MSTASRSKVFGMDVAIDPKLIILILLVVAGAVYYFTSSSSDSPGNGSASPTPSAVAPDVTRPTLNLAMSARAAARRGHVSVDRDVLKLVAIDGSRGDVDPTLRLGLLDRVKNVPPANGLRNLFDAGNPVMAENKLPPLPTKVPTIKPGPIMPVMPTIATPPPPPAFTIPLKYYGFARSKGRPADGSSRGLFLDGDNILIGGEGDVLERKFLIVALTPTSARLEDTQAKQRQDLPVTPEAPVTQ